MKIHRFFFLAGLAAILMVSCNLSEFKLNTYAKITGLDPVVYRPVSTGTYAVKDYVTFPETGFAPVVEDSLIYIANNQPFIDYPFYGMNFNTTGSDSMWVIIKTINETPMKYRYWLSYTPGKIMQSPILNAATVNGTGDVVTASKDSIEYKLNTNDVKNLGLATGMDLAITLYKPGTPVVANVLKTSQITFKIGFRAPINLFKLQ
jgi:hypothetical protein